MPKNLMEDIKLNKKNSFKKEIKSNNLDINTGNLISNKTYNISENIYVESRNLYNDNIDTKIDRFLNKKLSNKKELNNTKKSIFPINKIKNNKKSIKLIWIIFIFVIVFGLIYFMSDLFEKTTVNIIAKNQIFDVDKSINVSKNSDTPIQFDITIISGKEIEKMTLTEVIEASEKSKGEIILYNSFATTPQKIIAGTFLSDENGKTYKLNSTITIPGYKLDKNKKILPGEIIASITAFLPGDAYNGSPNSFYITSFKGTSKYSKIYGKLKTPLSGGISGTVYKLNDKERAKIDTIANTSFKSNLLKKAREQVPDNYIVYDDAINFKYEINDGMYFKDQNAEVGINGSLFLVLLKKDDLSKYILKNLLPKIDKSELDKISIDGLDQLKFVFSSDNQVVSKDTNSFSFNLLGKINARWNPDINEIKSKLVNTHKDDVIKIFKSDKTISEASVTIFPPWGKYVSSNPLKININLK